MSDNFDQKLMLFETAKISSVIFHDFRTLLHFEEKSSDHFKDLYKLKLLTNFDVNLTSSSGVVNYVLNI